MADSYIDPFETLISGKFAREQLAEVCLERVRELDPMVHYVIAAQERADAAMKLILDQKPKPAPPVDANEVLEETRDVVVRFGAYLESLKSRPSLFGAPKA